MAKELHLLLNKAKVRSPYVLVGHSLGSWVISIFAHLYPKESAGLVLVDPAYQESRLKSKASESEWAEREKALLKYTPPMNIYQKQEKDALEESGSQVLKAYTLPKIPIIMLTGTRVSEGFPLSVKEKEVKLEFHQNWIKRAPWTKQIFVLESRHYIQNEAPARVISAIEEILKTTGKKRQGPNDVKSIKQIRGQMK